MAEQIAARVRRVRRRTTSVHGQRQAEDAEAVSCIHPVAATPRVDNVASRMDAVDHAGEWAA